MRPYLLLTLLMLPMNACMTQRDATLWQEMKVEFFGSKAEAPAATPDAKVVPEAADQPAAKEVTETPAAASDLSDESLPASPAEAPADSSEVE